MWPDMVEFCSASSEIRGRKQEESVLKPKSADNYMSGGLIIDIVGETPASMQAERR